MFAFLDGVFFRKEMARRGMPRRICYILLKKIRQKKIIIRLCLSAANLRMILIGVNLGGDCAIGHSVIWYRHLKNSIKLDLSMNVTRPRFLKLTAPAIAR